MDFNRAGCYNDEAAALATIPEGEQGRYPLVADRLLPLRFTTTGAVKPITDRRLVPARLPDLSGEVGLNSYDPIGYDLGYGGEAGEWLGFGCSPLTCDGLVAALGANRLGRSAPRPAPMRSARRVAAPGPSRGRIL